MGSPSASNTADGLVQNSHAGLMMTAAELGFATARGLAEDAGIFTGPFTSPERARDVVKAIKAIEAARATLGFDIDGAVVKADRTQDRAVLGEGSRAPHWAVAYKYPPQQGSSIIEDIEVRTGRTGRISLRARIAPVFVGGTTITYASMHNPSWIDEQGIGIGSHVLVERRGDVIPRIEAPLDPSVNDDVPTWVPPEACPTCGEPWDTSSLLWRCHTPSCSTVGRITYFAGRDCMDIEGLGESIATALVESGLVSNIADLFDLTLTQWANLVVGSTFDRQRPTPRGDHRDEDPRQPGFCEDPAVQPGHHRARHPHDRPQRGTLACEGIPDHGPAPGCVGHRRRKHREVGRHQGDPHRHRAGRHGRGDRPARRSRGQHGR